MKFNYVIHVVFLLLVFDFHGDFFKSGKLNSNLNSNSKFAVSALENVQRQSDTCGVQTLIRNEVRSVAPWTVAVFKGKMPPEDVGDISLLPPNERPKFFSTGQVIGKNLIVLVHGGPAGKYINRNPNFFIVAGINTTDFSKHDKFRQMSKVIFIEPFRHHNVSNVYYHYVSYHLEKSLDFSTPYVRDACVPVFLTSKNTDWSSVEPYGWPGFQVGFAKVPKKSRRGNNGEKEEPIYDLKAWKALVGPKKTCQSVFNYYYNRRDLPFYCTTRVIQNYPAYTSILNSFSNVPEDNKLCQGTGSSFIYTLGQYCYLSHMVTMIPANKRGKCDLHSAYGQMLYYPKILIVLMEWLYFATRCGQNKFGCGADLKCVPISDVCNGVRDCDDGSDEHYSICNLPSSTMSMRMTSSGGEIVGLSTENLQFNKLVCPPLRFSSNGVTCTDLKRNTTIDCRKAGYNGAVIQLGCENFFTSPVYGFQSIETGCFDGTWKNLRPFFCEPVCGLLKAPDGEPLHTNYTGLPWHAAIFRDTVQVCGANLIENSFLITHAECVSEGLKFPERRNKFQAFIRPTTGSYWENLDNTVTEWYKIKKVWPTPSNLTTGNFGGFAVVQLVGSVETNGENKPMRGCSPLLSVKKVAVGQGGKMTVFRKSKGTNVDFNAKVIQNEECGQDLDPNQFCVKLVSTLEDEIPDGDLEFAGGLYFPKKTTGGRIVYVLKAIASDVGGRPVEGTRDTFIYTNIGKLSEWVVDTLERNS